MPIQAIDTERLYRKIAQQLSQLIDRGELPAGRRLPPERELAKQLGVSRPSVREALIALEIAGKVEVRVGAGVFVTQPTAEAPGEALDPGEGPFELLQARRLVEGEAAACAASEATAADLEVIRSAVDALGRLNGAEPLDEPDRAFHLAIAQATHNGPLAGVVQVLWDRGRGSIWRQMEKHFQTWELRAATLNDHQTILDAIEARRPRAARAAMHAHLTRVEREFSLGWRHASRSGPGSEAPTPAPRRAAR